MREIVTVSQSQRSNHLATQFYNCQDSLIEYSRWKESRNDPLVHFRATVTASTISFNPRALLWELSGGYGALGQYEYFGGDCGDCGEELEQRHESIVRKPVVKSAYQVALDNGTQAPKLTMESTRYWSDYSRVIYEPNSFSTLTNWEFDPDECPEGRLAMGKERSFKGFDVGVEEWANVGEDFLEDKLRVSLEHCDLLNGLNIVTELDSSWGAFSSELVEAIRDDYSPKSSIVTWAIHKPGSQKLALQERLDRIKTFMALQGSCTAFIPLSEMDQESMWISAAIQCIPFDTFQTMNSEKAQAGMNFHTMLQSLSLGSDRHLVSGVNATNGDDAWQFSDLLYNGEDSGHRFSEMSITRPASDGSSLDHQPEEVDRTTTNYTMEQCFNPPDSYPEGLISSEHPMGVTFSVDKSTRAKLIDMRKCVERLLRHGDERHGLVDELDTLAQRYEHGWEDDEEDFDD